MEMSHFRHKQTCGKLNSRRAFRWTVATNCYKIAIPQGNRLRSDLIEVPVRDGLTPPARPSAIVGKRLSH
jgi:hypothetical protein